MVEMTASLRRESGLPARDRPLLRSAGMSPPGIGAPPVPASGVRGEVAFEDSSGCGSPCPPGSDSPRNTGEVRRSVTDEELVWIKESAENYVKYARQYLADPGKNAGFKV